MSMMLLIGIVFTIVPLALILGFALVIFFSFVRDDPTAKGIVNFALIILGTGIILIVTHVIGQYFM